VMSVYTDITEELGFAGLEPAAVVAVAVPS
jgi:hypothetical protein